MKSFFIGKLLALLNIMPARFICRLEFKRQAFKRFNERPVELSFIFKQISKIYPKKILDVGSGASALPQLIRKCGCLVTAVDNIRDYWASGVSNRHYYVINDNITKTKLKDEFDFITCISVLEHIEDFDIAVKNMLSLLKPSGHLILTFPYSERKYIKNVYELQGSSYGQNASYITQSFSRTEIDNWLRNNNATIIEQEYWKFWDGDYWTVDRQVIPPIRVTADEKHQLTCILIQKK